MDKNFGNLKLTDEKTTWRGCAPVVVAGLSVVLLSLIIYSWPKSSPSSFNDPPSSSANQISRDNLLAQSAANNPPNQNQSPSDPSLAQSYTNTNFNYFIKYPADWIYELQSTGNMTFSGKEGTPAYEVAINISMISGDNLNSVVDNFKKSYTGDPSAKAQITNEKDYVYNVNGNNIQGKSFEASYVDSTDSTAYRDYVVIVPKGNQYFVWDYSAPTGQFDAYNKINQAMLGSWVINK